MTEEREVNARDVMLDAYKELLEVTNKLGLPADIGQLYSIAGVLTQAQMSQGQGTIVSYTDKGVQLVFAHHFAFMVKHSIDLIDLHYKK